jgi:hypothetical protein
LLLLQLLLLFLLRLLLRLRQTGTAALSLRAACTGSLSDSCSRWCTNFQVALQWSVTLVLALLLQTCLLLTGALAPCRGTHTAAAASRSTLRLVLLLNWQL